MSLSIKLSNEQDIFLNDPTKQAYLHGLPKSQTVHQWLAEAFVSEGRPSSYGDFVRAAGFAPVELLNVIDQKTFNDRIVASRNKEQVAPIQLADNSNGVFRPRSNQAPTRSDSDYAAMIQPPSPNQFRGLSDYTEGEVINNLEYERQKLARLAYKNLPSEEKARRIQEMNQALGSFVLDMIPIVGDFKAVKEASTPLEYTIAIVGAVAGTPGDVGKYGFKTVKAMSRTIIERMVMRGVDRDVARNVVKEAAEVAKQIKKMTSGPEGEYPEAFQIAVISKLISQIDLPMTKSMALPIKPEIIPTSVFRTKSQVIKVTLNDIDFGKNATYVAPGRAPNATVSNIGKAYPDAQEQLAAEKVAIYLNTAVAALRPLGDFDVPNVRTGDLAIKNRGIADIISSEKMTVESIYDRIKSKTDQANIMIIQKAFSSTEARTIDYDLMTRVKNLVFNSNGREKSIQELFFIRPDGGVVSFQREN